MSQRKKEIENSVKIVEYANGLQNDHVFATDSDKSNGSLKQRQQHKRSLNQNSKKKEVNGKRVRIIERT